MILHRYRRAVLLVYRRQRRSCLPTVSVNVLLVYLYAESSFVLISIEIIFLLHRATEHERDKSIATAADQLPDAFA